MKLNEKRVLLCNCEGTMSLDAKKIAKAFNQPSPHVFTDLCLSQRQKFTDSLRDGELLVACGRHVALFEELRSDLGKDPAAVTYVDIREKAGWGPAGKAASAKIAAMLAEAALDPCVAETVAVSSAGSILVYGGADAALEAASLLLGRLAPTVVLHRLDNDHLPGQFEFPIFKGQAASARGHMGSFEVVFERLAALRPSSRDSLLFDHARDDVRETFDLILDLSGDAPLFPANQTIDGHVRVSPTDKAGLFKALFELSNLQGEFSKPRYADVDNRLCAHSRSKVVGCTNCIDACSASAIDPAGDAVTINPYLCEGCGDCAAVCPTGAIAYALPSLDHIHQRLQVVLSTYRKAGGKDAVLLFHDPKTGEEALTMLGKKGTGLPANVIPFALNSVAIMDHGLLLAALAYGAQGVVLLLPPSRQHSSQATIDEVALAQALLEGFQIDPARFHLIEDMDPDHIESGLADLTFPKSLAPMNGLAVGGKRQRTRRVLAHLQGSHAKIHMVPTTAPYGQVVLDQQNCTLCMSCVGACPTQALRANPKAPILSFIEQDCVQCGLCKSTCPEDAIDLDPRLCLDNRAAKPQLLKQDQPAICPDCGKTFGAQSAIDRIVERLSNLPQFSDETQLANLRKCEDCRVGAILKQRQPLHSGDRPRPRTTDDYLN